MNKTTSKTHMIAVLAASGLNENDLTETQKAVQKTNIGLQIISLDQGLLSSWNAQGWGLSFTADSQLNQALAADYAALLIPGGQRSVEKLKTTAHTRRFINGFMDNGKPVIVLNEAVDLLIHTEKMSGRTISSPDVMKDKITAAGGTWSESMIEQDDNLMTINSARDPKVSFAPVIMEFLNANFALKKAA